MIKRYAAINLPPNFPQHLPNPKNEELLFLELFKCIQEKNDQLFTDFLDYRAIDNSKGSECNKLA